MMRASNPVLALAVLAACAAEAAREPLEAPVVELVEELRLDPHVEDFVGISSLDVGPGGMLIVPQRQDHQLRVYDSAGAHVATVGRPGGGPGEFQAIAGHGWAGDTIWAHDVEHQRITRFTADGALVRSTALPSTLMMGAPVLGDTGSILFFSPSVIRADGAMLGEARLRSDASERVLLLAPPEAAAGDASTSTGPSEDEARLARIVARPPAYEDGQWYMQVAGFGRFVPFAARPIVSLGPDGRRFAYLTTEPADENGGTFTLTIMEMTSDTVLSRSYPYRGIPIPGGVRDSVLAAFIPRDGGPREGPADLPQRFQAIAHERMPSIYPPVMAMMLGMDGSAWLTMRDTGDGRRALILDDDGSRLGTFPLPPRATIRQATATHVWMTQTDEDGLASVLRYRVIGVRSRRSNQ